MNNIEGSSLPKLEIQLQMRTFIIIDLQRSMILMVISMILTIFRVKVAILTRAGIELDVSFSASKWLLGETISVSRKDARITDNMMMYSVTDFVQEESATSFDTDIVFRK